MGRESCGVLAIAEQREWLVSNGIGGFACGTVAGVLSRHYHGLLVAPLAPPVGCTLLLAKLAETVVYGQRTWELDTNRWRDGAIAPRGYQYLQSFDLDGSVPVWVYALGDGLLEKRVWMETGANVTYVRYTWLRGQGPLHVCAKALVDDRDRHHSTRAGTLLFQVMPVATGRDRQLTITTLSTGNRWTLATDRGTLTPKGVWYEGYELAIERYRGIDPHDDRYHAATIEALLLPGESLTVRASAVQPQPSRENGTGAKPSTRQPAGNPSEAIASDQALLWRQKQDRALMAAGRSLVPAKTPVPPWRDRLLLAADAFIADRRLPNGTQGKTIIAGYPWFSDWGRDTAIALPGLTVAAGRPELARPILRAFAHYLDQGMLPNYFPDHHLQPPPATIPPSASLDAPLGEATNTACLDQSPSPVYNTVDAVWWYVEAVRIYAQATGDRALIAELYPHLIEIVDWHERGTRYGIHLADDGLISAGAEGQQLTWMDAKVADWVVTPRHGKPIEVNALWYSALGTLLELGTWLERDPQELERWHRLAMQAWRGFQQFWNPAADYAFDVLDGPQGADAAIRPNAIFTIALPLAAQGLPAHRLPPLWSRDRQRILLNTCAQHLFTDHGLRSLAPDHPDYCPVYGGDRWERDGAYHQGTVWGWLLGPFAIAHWHVWGDRAAALALLDPLAATLTDGCVGQLSEIFDAEPPFAARGAFAQAWTVGTLLQAWQAIALTR
jgi:glycogen debranching enzyme